MVRFQRIAMWISMALLYKRYSVLPSPKEVVIECTIFCYWFSKQISEAHSAQNIIFSHKSKSQKQTSVPKSGIIEDSCQSNFRINQLK